MDAFNSNRRYGKLKLYIMLVSAFLVSACLSFAASCPEITVKKGERLLVIAPHPDDELIACGGLMQRVKSSGGKVIVLFLTPGDGGYMWNPLSYINPKGSRLKMGERRMEEAACALAALGLCKEEAVFLGFPDKGLLRLWDKFIDDDGSVFSSPYTGRNRVSYKNLPTSGVSYEGVILYRYLVHYIGTFRPDLILFPSALDTHPDHQAACYFSKAAVVFLYGADTPAIFSYPVHRSKKELTNVTAGQLHRFTLKRTEQANKLRALQCYKTQKITIRRLIYLYREGKETFYPEKIKRLTYGSNLLYAPEPKKGGFTIRYEIGDGHSALRLSRAKPVKKDGKISFVFTNKTDEVIRKVVAFPARQRDLEIRLPAPGKTFFLSVGEVARRNINKSILPGDIYFFSD